MIEDIYWIVLNLCKMATMTGLSYFIATWMERRFVLFCGIAYVRAFTLSLGKKLGGI